VLPVIALLALFGVIALVACCCITLGPVAHVEANSLTYSAIRPPRHACMHACLPPCLPL
jgi:hypothetical protein